MKLKLLASALGFAVCGAVLAQPSGGFHLYKNKVSGQTVCMQHAISPDWIKQTGPFKDPDCRLEEKPAPARTDLPASPLDLAPKPQR